MLCTREAEAASVPAGERTAGIVTSKTSQRVARSTSQVRPAGIPGLVSVHAYAPEAHALWEIACGRADTHRRTVRAVFVEGAKLSMGDMHFSQGDGEVSFCGAIEMSGFLELKCAFLLPSLPLPHMVPCHALKLALMQSSTLLHP